MKFPIHESKNSDKVTGYCNINDLTKHCSSAYAKKIIAAQENGQLYGLYLTNAGRIKANFI